MKKLVWFLSIPFMVMYYFWYIIIKLLEGLFYYGLFMWIFHNERR
jgi:hypothetical protein